MKTITLISILLFIFSSCKNEPLTNLTDAKDRVREYYESGEINEEIKIVVEQAIEDLDNLDLSENSAAVFDIDETALSSYEYTKSLDFGYNWTSWTEWQLKSIAVAIPEVKRLYDVLIEKKVKVIFLTGKRIEVYDATFKNLIQEEYKEFDTLICRRENEFETKAYKYKSFHRKRLTDEGYKIIMCVGDQESDLIGENTGIKVKVPNYLYKLN